MGSDEEVLAMASHLPLRGFRGTLKLLRYARGVMGQLEDAAGLVGYSMRAGILRHEFLTLSVWRDHASLMEFVGRSPHRDVMEALHPYMGSPKFVTWQVKGSVVPPSWDGALQKLRDTLAGAIK